VIELDITQFLAGLLIGIAVLAAFSVAWDRLRGQFAAKALRRDTVHCRVCGAAYRRTGNETIQSCPECESPNPSGRDRRLG